MVKFSVKFNFFALFFIAIPVFLYGQSTAAEIETLLNTTAVTYGQASRFVLEAADVLAAKRPDEAFAFAVQKGWLPANIAYDEPARLNHISLLLMRSFDTGGGIMYSITGSSRYAYRELVYMNVIQGSTDPAMMVSGERLIFYVNRMYARHDAVELAASIKKERQQEKEAAARRRELASVISVVIKSEHIQDTTVEATDEGVKITLSNIMFRAESAELPDSEKAKLREIARILRTLNNVKLQIAGHTALAGSEEGRLQISRNRAQSVADYLVSIGACRAANVTVVGYGATRPIADNRTEHGMAVNRRVEIIILEN